MLLPAACMDCQINLNNMKSNSTARKRVLLLGINFSPELTGIGKYSGEMIDWLTDNNYDCTVVTSFPYYPTWSIQEPYKGNFYKKELTKDGRMKVYRCPLYVPAHPTGLKRIIHDASFFLSSFFIIFYLLFKKNHDQIICMAPPFHLGFLGMFYRFFKGGKLTYHIHDMQIEAARDLNIIKSDAVLNTLFGLEKIILNNADHVSTISVGMIQKVSAKIDREILLFPNWVDTKLFCPVAQRNRLKADWGFKTTDKIVLYSGSIGEKQGLEKLIQIAAETELYRDIKYVICGDGPYKQKLSDMAKAKNLSNMSFLSLQPLETFNSLLNMTDVHLVLQKKSACDLMMPSKLTTIWSSGGLALVTAEPGTTLYNAIHEHQMAVVIDCEDEVLLKKTILDCCIEDHALERKNARIYALDYLSKESILKKFMADLGYESNSSFPQHETIRIPELISEPAVMSGYTSLTQMPL